MRRLPRRRWIPVLVALFAVVAAITWRLRTRVETYQGKGIEYWMWLTHSSDLDDNPGLKAIGTNAVPTLGRALRTPPTALDRHAWLRSPRVQTALKNLAPNSTWTRSAREAQWAAAYSLLTFGFEARAALTDLHEALINPALTGDTRQIVVEVLNEIGPLPESLPFLLGAWPLTTNSSFVPEQHDLVVTLGRISRFAPEKCLPIFLNALGDKDENIRDAAMWGVAALGQMAHAATPMLAETLHATNHYAQFTAAVALGRITNSQPALLPRLRELARGTNAQPAAGAALTLWRWGEPADQSVAVLIRFLPNKEAKGMAAEYLGVMGPAATAALPALIEASQHDIGAWVDRYDRARCALAVLQIGGSNAVAYAELEAALGFKANSWVRNAVARDLGKQGGLAKPLTGALRQNLNDSNRDARHAAVKALENIERADPEAQ